MKNYKGLMLIAFMALCTTTLSQTKSGSRFSDINLKEIRKTVLKNLRSDELISGKLDEVYLISRESGVWVNQHKLEGSLLSKYENLLADYNVGKGQDRAVFLSKDCTAVGDFTDDSFHGKIKGRMRLEYTSGPLPGEQ